MAVGVAVRLYGCKVGRGEVGEGRCSRQVEGLIVPGALERGSLSWGIKSGHVNEMCA